MGEGGERECQRTCPINCTAASSTASYEVTSSPVRSFSLLAACALADASSTPLAAWMPLPVSTRVRQMI